MWDMTSVSLHLKDNAKVTVDFELNLIKINDVTIFFPNAEALTETVGVLNTLGKRYSPRLVRRSVQLDWSGK